MGTTVAEIKRRLQEADEQEFAVLERSLVADTRKGVRSAVEVARRRLDAERAERERLEGLYALEDSIMAERGAACCVGLDEVGRGPVAGPLAVGAVVLPREPRIAGLNDSKQVSPAERERIAAEVKRIALAWAVEYASPEEIDGAGMSACLRRTFRRAVERIEAAGVHPDVILLDGNPLHLDERECNLVKGDARIASIIAKVERDALMVELGERYPEYDFASNKGYASAEHIDAIKRLGLTPVHRASFCTSLAQQSLF